MGARRRDPSGPLGVGGEQQGADGNGVLAQAGEEDRGAGLEDFHQIGLQGFGHGHAQGFSHEGQSAADDDPLGVHEVGDVGEGKAEVVGELAENGLGQRVPGREGGRKVPRFTAPGAVDEEGQRAARVQGDGFANAAIHGPAGTSLLDENAGLVEAHMADLGFAGFGAVIDALVDHEATADTGAEGDVEDGGGAATVSGHGLPEGGDVGVVVDRDGDPDLLVEPRRERKSGPALDLMGFRDAAGAPVHGAAEADAEGGRAEFAGGFGQPGGDLASDAVGAFATIDVMSPATEDGAIGPTGHELEFGAADFEGEEGMLLHGGIEAEVEGGCQGRRGRG